MPFFLKNKRAASSVEVCCGPNTIVKCKKKSTIYGTIITFPISLSLSGWGGGGTYKTERLASACAASKTHFFLKRRWFLLAVHFSPLFFPPYCCCYCAMVNDLSLQYNVIIRDCYGSSRRIHIFVAFSDYGKATLEIQQVGWHTSLLYTGQVPAIKMDTSSIVLQACFFT